MNSSDLEAMGPLSDRTRELYRHAVICDMTLPWEADCTENRSTVLDRFKACGFHYVSLTLADDRERLPQTIRHIAAETRLIQSQPDKYLLVNTVEDILRAKRENKLALGFHFQGTNSLDGDVNMVALYHRLGVRHMLMAYNQKNLVGDGCHERTDGGLSRFGVEVVRAMNEVGMLVDCSHTGYRTSMDVFEVSEAPVIFSHSNARAICDHSRNIRDEQIRACAKSGGVIGMNGVGMFIDDNRASAEGLFAHIDYISTMVGAEHVGLGIDLVYFENTMYEIYRANPNMYPKEYVAPPWKFFQPEQLPYLTDLMVRADYSDADVLGILGQNWLRVAGAVWG
jgi:membrane dipeptidase